MAYDISKSQEQQTLVLIKPYEFTLDKNLD